MGYNDNTNNYSVLNNLKAKISEGEWEIVETLLKDNIEKEYLLSCYLIIVNSLFLSILYTSKSFWNSFREMSIKRHIITYSSTSSQWNPFVTSISQVSLKSSVTSFQWRYVYSLFTHKTISSSPYFQHWPGIIKAREILFKTLSTGFQEAPLILEKPVFLHLFVHPPDPW